MAFLGNIEPLVSAVVPTHNRRDLLGRAIDSVLSQTYEAWELIVVDDASSDGTAQFLDSLSDTRVRFKSHSTRLGANAARNAGIEMSRGEYVAFLDSDDEWLPSKLEKQVAIIESNPEIGLVYCGHYGAMEGVSGHVDPEIDYRTGVVYGDLLGGWCPHGNSLTVVRRSLLDEVGLFDIDLMGFQDYDLWIRLARRARFEAVRERLVVKYQHSGHQLTTDAGARSQALDSFVEKWAREMTIEQGDGAPQRILRYHRRQIARKSVLAAVRQGAKSEAWANYRTLAAFTDRTWGGFVSLASLLPGLVLGYRGHLAARSIIKPRSTGTTPGDIRQSGAP